MGRGEPMLIEVEHGNDICILRLSGHFRSGEDPDYARDKADEIRSHECKNILADVRELLSIGSMGMGFVIGVYVYITKRSDGRFVLLGANQRVREVLDLTRLSSIISMAADVPSALAALRGERHIEYSAGTA
jgi:anti-anti-sigma factor